jgi:hypothetical protein
MIGAEVDEGAPLPDEKDVVPCRTCGGRHVQVVVEVEVGEVTDPCPSPP